LSNRLLLFAHRRDPGKLPGRRLKRAWGSMKRYGSIRRTECNSSRSATSRQASVAFFPSRNSPPGSESTCLRTRFFPSPYSFMD